MKRELVIIAALVAWPAVASAQNDAGPDAGDAGVVDIGAADVDNNSEPPPPPLACGGALCDSSNDSTCSMPSTPAGPLSPFVLALAAVLPLAALARRRRR